MVRSHIGDVAITQPSGYGTPGGDARLFVGSRVMSGPGSSASVDFGETCAIALEADLTLKVDPIGDGICVWMDSPERAVFGNDPAKLAAGLIGIGGVVGAVLLLGSGDDQPASF